MASKLFFKFTILNLIMGATIASFPAPVLASSQPALSTLKLHAIKFYFDPTLVPDMTFAQSVLPKYVADMNSILAKNTDRQLTFEPQTDILLTSTKPHTDSAPPPLPTEDFEIWAYAIPSTSGISYKGYAGIDRSGAGVLAGMRWLKLYDPDDLSQSEYLDYARQLHVMTHELAHVFNAGIGEYYNLSSIKDTTGIKPLLDINLNDANDPFWATKPDFKKDPLLLAVSAVDRNDYLSKVRYSDLTAAIINGVYRNGIPSFEQFTVQVLNESGVPLPSANIKVWNISGVYPNESQLVLDAFTDDNGQVIVNWGASINTHNAGNFLRLIKVYKDGLALAQPKYISIYDMDIAALVLGTSSLTVTFQQSSLMLETFLSIGSHDGWSLESSETSNKGGKMDKTASTINVGDDAFNRQYHAILSFDTSTLPDDAVISLVTLKFKYAGKTGGLPFSTHGNLLADIRNGSFSNNPALQLSDFRAAASKINVLSFDDIKMDNWYSQSFSPADFININLTDVTQFRLGFANDDNNDNGADFLKIYSGNAGAANAPKLVIEYYVP